MSTPVKIAIACSLVGTTLVFEVLIYVAFTINVVFGIFITGLLLALYGAIGAGMIHDLLENQIKRRVNNDNRTIN